MKHGNDISIGLDTSGNSIVLDRVARSKHQYVVGATGTGKSKLLEHMIRQDILKRHESGCGMLLLDPHGSLQQNVMSWLASNDMKRWPVIPIDLRRSDWITSYNPLRKRPDRDIAAIVAAFSRAIAHAWGKSGLEATPRLSKWLHAMLYLLYVNNCTLGESLHLIRSPDMRRQMIAQVEDLVAKSVWEASLHLKESEFQEQLESTVSRLVKFLSNQIMRATLCQADVSLDLDNALQVGSIVLVSLATQGNQIDEEDAATFGAILLSDLWTAAKARGKGETVRPFYVYVDEFQEFVAPSMAKALDQARGFGIHFTLSHQFPSQVLAQGEQGKLVFNSVMANTRNKVIFQLEHPEDLPLLATWIGRNSIDLNEIKYQHFSTKVLGHQIVYMPSYGTSETQGTAASDNWSHTEGSNHSTSTQWSHTESDQASLTKGKSRTRSRGNSRARSRTRSAGESESAGESWSDGDSISNTKSNGSEESETEGLSFSARELEMELDDPELEFQEEFEEHPHRRRTWSNSRGSSSSSGESSTSGSNRSRGGSRTLSKQSGHADGESESGDTSEAESTADSMAVGHSSSDTYGGGESLGTSESDTVGGSVTLSRSKGRSVTNSPMLIPIMGKEASPPIFRSLEEQLFRLTQQLSSLPDRHFVARLAGDALPIAGATMTIRPASVMPRWLELWTVSRLKRIPFARTMPEALKQIADRARQLALADRGDDLIDVRRRLS